MDSSLDIYPQSAAYPAEAPPRLTESSSSAPPLHGVAAAAWHRAAAAHPLAIKGIGDIKGMLAMR